MANLIHQGAEAKIYRTAWKNRPAIIKKRLPKSYRLPEIDQMLRRHRTRQEALLIVEARKGGTPTPIIYDVDMATTTITMEWVDGRRVKDCIDGLPEDNQRSICEHIGWGIAGLHKQEVVHGDITTSNLIIAKEKVYFIDFGLGEKVDNLEKRGVDLHILLEAFTAAHAEERLFSWVLSAYKKNVPWGKKVQHKLAEIGERGRYMERG